MDWKQRITFTILMYFMSIWSSINAVASFNRDGVIHQQECSSDGDCGAYHPMFHTEDHLDEENLCPYPPPGLGPMDLYLSKNNDMTDMPQLADIEGGSWKPNHCKSRQKVAVIVIFRDRWDDLKIFLPNIHQFLKAQLLDYSIFLSEQTAEKHFNRGTLFNAAFQEVMKSNYDCLILHDVDKIPEDTRNLYMCTDMPTHLFASQRNINSISKTYNKRPYDGYFGGVRAVSTIQFQQANGFSNNFWGWGNEDDDFRDRLLHQNFTLKRVSDDIGVYKEIKRPLQFVNPRRHEVMKEESSNYLTNGLNNLNIQILSVTTEKLYTNISVAILAEDPYAHLPLERIGS